MSPREQIAAASDPAEARNASPAADVSAQPTPPAKSKRRQLYVFLIAADLVVLFIYFFLVPKDTWESYDARLRSIASLAGSLIAYLGLSALLQRYVAKFSFIDQTAFRAIVWFVTPILWAAILPVWSVHLIIRPRQMSPMEVQISSQTAVSGAAPGQTKTASTAIYRYCEVSPSERTATSDETICAFGQLLLRPYEIKLKEAPNSTYLPAASIFVNTFIRHAFPVQLPCRLEVTPVYPNEKVSTKRLGEDQVDHGLLPGDGILWLMPGRYEYIKATAGRRHGEATLDMPCQADYVKEIPLE